MSSMYLDSPLRGQIDPVTGLPRQKQKQQQRRSVSPWGAIPQSQIQASLAANPLSTFGGSPAVDYGFGRLGEYRIPGGPDYKSLIEAQLKPLRDELGAQGVADTSQLTAATQRALTLSGLIPDFQGQPPSGLDLNLFNQAVTPEVRQLAQQNTEAGLSGQARLDRAFKDRVRQIKNMLAARGALRSGETGRALQDAQLERDQAQFDSVNDLVEYVAGLQAGLAERERQRRLQEAQAAAGAEAQVRAAYPATAPVGGNTAGQLPAADFQQSPLPPGWISGPNSQQITGPTVPLDLSKILGVVKPPDPRDIRLPGGGGELSYFGI